MIVPPFKVALEFFPNKMKGAFLGGELNFQGIIMPVGSTGMYLGYKKFNLLIEEKINFLFAWSLEGERGIIISHSPKIGTDVQSCYLKIGPYFEIVNYGSITNSLLYLKIKHRPLPFDIGFYKHSSEKTWLD